jgi:hypothetical protein
VGGGAAGFAPSSLDQVGHAAAIGSKLRDSINRLTAGWHEVQSLTSVFDPRRISAAMSLMLSVFLALSLWTAFGPATKTTLSAPSGPEFCRSDDPSEGGQARLAAEVELKEEDNEGSDSPIGEADLCSSRDLLAFVPSSACRAWRAEARSLVSQRVREGHGARGPPHA